MHLLLSGLVNSRRILVESNRRFLTLKLNQMQKFFTKIPVHAIVVIDMDEL